MLLVSTYVAQSPIEGLGVFAAEPLKAGQLIWSLNLKFDLFIEESEIDGLPPQIRDYFARYTYPHPERPGIVVFESDNGRYMNHSATPNTDFRIFEKGYALVDVAVGEELTCNYYEIDPEFVDFVVTAAPQTGARSNGR